MLSAQAKARMQMYAGDNVEAVRILQAAGYDPREAEEFLYWNQGSAPLGPLGAAPNMAWAQWSVVAGLGIAVVAGAWMAFRG